jgi:hypothetical protein
LKKNSRDPYEAIDTSYGSLGLFLPYLCGLNGNMQKVNIFKFLKVSQNKLKMLLKAGFWIRIYFRIDRTVFRIDPDSEFLLNLDPDLLPHAVWLQAARPHAVLSHAVLSWAAPPHAARASLLLSIVAALPHAILPHAAPSFADPDPVHFYPKDPDPG